MKAYFKHMKERGAAERISILTYDRLVPYYKALGFEHYGKSESEYAGVAWHDLVSGIPCYHRTLLTFLVICILGGLEKMAYDIE
jgi:hypothetical protein